jgi:hypothetical protein
MSYFVTIFSSTNIILMGMPHHFWPITQKILEQLRHSQNRKDATPFFLGGEGDSLNLGRL